METRTGGEGNTKAAYRFILLLGVVSLCADVTYEGARSITGPFLATLGASATVVGVVAGLGELIGYSLRLGSGYLADRTRRYWLLTLTGYALNLIAVPLLALAGRWEVAAGLMVMERLGKAIRTPARDAMLSHATRQVGRGWGFGLHEAMDQIGALMGPLLIAAVLSRQGSYRYGFGILLFPALLALVTLLTARRLYPQPQDFEAGSLPLEGKGLPRTFWLYLGAVGLLAAGYADFPLIAYHIKTTGLAPDHWIPLFYALAMGIDALAALLLGHLFDRKGLAVLPLAGISLFFPPLVFGGTFPLALGGMLLWGIGMGAQESVLRAAIAEMVPMDRRGAAYGIFHTGYGVAWFLGSALMGKLYDTTLPGLILFSVLVQLTALPLLFRVGREAR